MNLFCIRSVTLFCLFGTGCTTGAPTPLFGDERNAAVSLILTSEEIDGVLALVNDCGVGLVTLDVDAALDARAAAAIVAHRDGSDGACGNGDDRPFTNLDELDAVPYVGDACLTRLLSYAQAHGYIAGADPIVGYFDEVAFTATEVAQVIVLCNRASLATLDDEVGLDARAAAAIVTARPFDAADPLANLAAIAAAPYVGAGALQALKAFAASYSSGCAALGGTFESVVFSDAQANAVLDLANHGASAVLDTITGIGPTLAGRIIAARPLADLPALGAVSNVGATVLTNLRDEVATTWCTLPAATCDCDTTTPETTFTYDGVTFTQNEAQTALAVVNTASRAQLRADVGLDQALTETLLGGRPWASLALVAAAPGVGTAALTNLVTLVQARLWQGPGPMTTAITVLDLLANLDALTGGFVSFNTVLLTPGTAITSTTAHTVGNLRDSDQGSAAVSLRIFLCNPAIGDCADPPALAEGDLVELVHVRVESDTTGPWLRLVDTSEFRVLGCAPGWARTCGIDVGVCEIGSETCTGVDWDPCTGDVAQLSDDPADGLDNDCDGVTDENAFSLTATGYLGTSVSRFTPNGANSLATGVGERLLLDVSAPAVPAVLSRTTATTQVAGGIRVYSQYTVVAGCRSGTALYANPVNELVPTITLPAAAGTAVGCVYDAVIAGDLLITAEWYNGVDIYDLATPDLPKKGHLAITFPRALAVVGDGLWVLGEHLDVFDLGNGNQPTLRQTFTLPNGQAMATNAAGLVVVSASAGLFVFDAAIPTNPVAYPVWRGIDASTVDLRGTLLASVPQGSDRTLKLVDLEIPSAPRLVADTVVPNGTGTLAGSALRGVSLTDDLVWVYGGTGLYAYTIGE